MEGGASMNQREPVESERGSCGGEGYAGIVLGWVAGLARG